VTYRRPNGGINLIAPAKLKVAVHVVACQKARRGPRSAAAYSCVSVPFLDPRAQSNCDAMLRWPPRNRFLAEPHPSVTHTVKRLTAGGNQKGKRTNPDLPFDLLASVSWSCGKEVGQPRQFFLFLTRIGPPIQAARSEPRRALWRDLVGCGRTGFARPPTTKGLRWRLCGRHRAGGGSFGRGLNCDPPSDMSVRNRVGSRSTSLLASKN
jgi:hypothetical protein